MSISRPVLVVVCVCLLVELAIPTLVRAATARVPLKPSFLRQPASSPAATIHRLPSAASAPPAWDTSSWFGAAYTPAPAGNQLWWYEYDRYEPLVKAELQAASAVFGFTALRTFIHSMVHANDSSRFIQSIDRYLAIAHSVGIKPGFVFFDDCWSSDGATLPNSCVPVKGRHNGCWKTSPQAVERTSIDRFKSYVTDIVGAFRNDSRVLYWEIFNEPNSSNFTSTLRHTAYGWATSMQPIQPVISCWGDNPDTDIVDEHRYDQNFAGWTNDIYANPKKGGVVTEGGSRWYQGYDTDAGSTKLVMTWLAALRAAYSEGTVFFVPGMIVSWELNVGNSHTRWHWSTPDGSAEPTIPWDAHMHWDHTPVSYTEAALIQQYTKGTSPFYCVATFMEHSYMFTADNYTVATSQNPGDPICPLADGAVVGDAIYEMSFWPSSNSRLSLVTHSSGGSSPDSYVFSVDLRSNMLRIGKYNNSAYRTHGQYNISQLESGVPTNGWSLLRVVASQASFDVYLNPMASEAMDGGIKPRLSWHDDDPLPAGAARLAVAEGTVRVDYFSATKLASFGEYVRKPAHRSVDSASNSVADKKVVSE